MTRPDEELRRNEGRLRVACFLPSLEGGGAERVTINLLQAIHDRQQSASGQDATQNGLPLVQMKLVLAQASGPFLSQVPASVELVDLAAGRVSRSIRPLARFLRAWPADVLLSHLSHANIAAILARAWSRVRLRHICVEHLTMSAYRGDVRRDFWIRPLARLLYRRADAVVAVSQAAARDLERQLHRAPGSVQVIPNPVADPRLRAVAEHEPAHPWLVNKSSPVLVAVGRLTEQKGFDTLLRAFAELRRSGNGSKNGSENGSGDRGDDCGGDTDQARLGLRLILLGEGPQRPKLEKLVEELQLGSTVSLPGFVENPYAIIRRSDCLVLSSRWEALPTVLIEALACGCPVVATDCPSGPAEILAGGRYGRLVAVDQPLALAAAIRATLAESRAGGIDRDQLRTRAEHYSFQAAARRYLALFVPAT